MPIISIIAIDTVVVSRAIMQKYSGDDAHVRALEYLGKILQLRVGLPDPGEAQKRELLELVVPKKAGGRDRHRLSEEDGGGGGGGGALSLDAPQQALLDKKGLRITIMEADPLLGFEDEERDSFRSAAPFLTANSRKCKRIVNSCTSSPQLTRPASVQTLWQWQAPVRLDLAVGISQNNSLLRPSFSSFSIVPNSLSRTLKWSDSRRLCVVWRD